MACGVARPHDAGKQLDSHPRDQYPLGLIRIAVVHNIDYQQYPKGAASYEADAEVRETAEAVAAALGSHGFEAIVATVADELEPLRAELIDRKVDAVFNLVESLAGDCSREPDLPAMLDALGIAYTGNRAEVLRVAHAKDETRRILESHGIRVPVGVSVGDIREAKSELDRLGLAFPLFVKPARTDASIGIDQASIVRDFAALERKLRCLAAQVPGPYLIEQYVPGREVNVAIFPEPVAGHLVCTDIDFSECAEGVAPIVTYDCKWRPGTPDYMARSLPSRGRLPDAEIAAAQRVARDAFLAIGGTSYGRVDLRAGCDGAFYVIDVNPNPDIHPEAGLAIAARSVGFEHDLLVLRVMETAMENARAEARHAAQNDPLRGPGAARGAPLTR